MIDSVEEEHRREIERLQELQKQRQLEAYTALLPQLPATTSEEPSELSPSPGLTPSGVSPSPDVEATEEGGGVFDTLADVGTQLVGGAFDGIDSMLSLPSEIMGGESVDYMPPIEESNSVAGSIARGIGQFGVGFIPGLSVVRTLQYATKGAKALQGARALVASKPVIGSIATGAGAGAVADFAAFGGNEGRLTDILADLSEDHPAVDSLVIDYLRSDDDDGAIEGRFKNMLEGLVVGGVADASLLGLGKVAGNLKFIKKMKKDSLEAGSPNEFSNLITDKSDRLLIIDHDYQEVKSILDFVEGRQFTKAELDTAEYSKEVGEGTLEAAERLFPRNAEALEEPSRLGALRERDPELYEKASGEVEQLRTLKNELEEELTAAKKEWFEARTGKDGLTFKPARWDEIDGKVSSTFDDTDKANLESWKSLPDSAKFEQSTVQELTSLRKIAEETRASRVTSIPSWDGKNFQGDSSVFDRLNQNKNIDKFDVKVFKEALKNNDGSSAARIANKADLIIEVDRPQGKDESIQDFLSRTAFFRSIRSASTLGEDSLRTGGPRAKQIKTNIDTEEQGKKFAKIVSENKDAQSLIGDADGATAQTLNDFVNFAEGVVDLKRMPDIFAGVRQILFEMRLNMTQRGIKIQSGTATDLEKYEFMRAGETISNLTDAYSGNVSRVAQTLQAQRISPDPWERDWFSDMEMEMGTINEDQLQKTAALITAAGDSATVARIAREAKGFKAGKAHILPEIWTNSILSGPITTAVNAMSGAFQTLYVPFEGMAGAALRGDLEGFRTEMAHFRGIVESTRGLIRMIARSSDNVDQTMGTTPFKNTIEAWKTQGGILDSRTSFDENAIAFTSGNFGMQQGTWAAAKVDSLGRMIRFPGRVMLTADEMIKGINYNMRLQRDGFKLAREQGVDDVDGFIRDYMTRTANYKKINTKTAQGQKEQAIFKLRHEKALEYARRATFQEDLRANSWAKSLQTFTAKHPTMRLVMPFVRTPNNILKFVGQRTPGLNRLSAEVREDLAAGGARAQAVRDRLAISTMIWGTGMVQVAQGNITGGYPNDFRERQAWELAGIPPYSIRTGVDAEGKNTWVSYRRADPIGMFFGLAADMGEAFTNMDTNDPDVLEIINAAVVSLSGNIKSKSYFTGLTQVLNVLDNPERYGESWMQRQISSFVPNLLSQQRRYGSEALGGDETMREVNSLSDALRNRIPGLSYGLAPRRNIFGEIQKYPSGVSPAVANPFFVANSNVSPEMLRQLRAGTFDLKSAPLEERAGLAAVMLGYTPNMSSFDEVGGVELTPQQRDQLIQIVGPRLKQSLSTLVSRWKFLTPPEPGHKEDSGQYQAYRKIVQRHIRNGKNVLYSARTPESEALRASVKAERLERTVRRQKENKRPDEVLSGTTYSF